MPNKKAPVVFTPSLELLGFGTLYIRVLVFIFTVLNRVFELHFFLLPYDESQTGAHLKMFYIKYYAEMMTMKTRRKKFISFINYNNYCSSGFCFYFISSKILAVFILA